MKILRFSAENVRRLSVVEIKPDGNVIEITGRNGQGKTSVLDSIRYALEGKPGKLEWKPVRKGEEKASIRLDLGTDKGVQFIVTRTFRDQGDDTYTTTLKVEGPDGYAEKSPQAILDRLVSALSIDPLAFQRMKPDDRIDLLRSLVSGVDFAGIERKQEAIRAKRRDVGRDLDSLKAQAEAIVVPMEAPEKPVDTTAILAELEAIGSKMEAVVTESNRRAGIAREVEGLRKQRADELDDAADYRAQAAKLIAKAEASEETAKVCERLIAEHETEIAALPPIEPAPDPAEVRRRLDEANRLNSLAGLRTRRKDLELQAEEAARRYSSMTAEIEGLDRQVAEAVAKADLPVRGMTLAKEDVLMNGLPFAQASDAEQLRASTALAMALSPDLRVIRIRDGSLLDKDAMAVIREVAAGEDFQFWIERVEPSGTGPAIIMEDGRVVKK